MLFHPRRDLTECAQKAAKSLATRNAATLQRTHLISAVLNILFLFLHFLFNRPASLLRYVLFASPALVLEFYLERLGRPTYNSDDGSLLRSGEDLEAKGLTEYMWDVVYWTWICLGAACIFGDRAWWLYLAIPLYSAWAAYKTVGGMRDGFAGGQAQAPDQGQPGGESKRQKKMEKRGGQKVQYR